MWPHGLQGFNALGTSVFVDTAPPTLVYDTETAALTVGPAFLTVTGTLT